MTTVSQKEFVQRFADARLPVDGLTGAARLRGVAVAAADANGDGVIAGRSEAAALWRAMGNADVVETTTSRRLLPFLPFLPARSVPSVAGQRLEALESFRVADVLTRQNAARGDAFARDGVLRNGPARGEPLDTTRARPVVLLDAAAKAEACQKAGVDPATIEHAFANLSHGGAFYTTLVPRDAVKHVGVMIESFPAPVPAAHAMLRFTLADDKPAILVPQHADGQGTLALRDLVFSAEALGQPGWKYDLVKGQQGHFAVVDRFESLEDRYRHVNSYTPAHPTVTHPLRVRAGEANDVLREALSTSAKVGLGAAYNTLNRSCGTEAFAVLDRGIGDDVPLGVRLSRAITGERLPPLADKYLALRGLLAPGHRPVDLNGEWARAPRPATPR